MSKRKRIRKWLLAKLVESIGCPAQALSCDVCHDGQGSTPVQPGTVCSAAMRRRCWLDEARLQIEGDDGDD